MVLELHLNWEHQCSVENCVLLDFSTSRLSAMDTTHFISSLVHSLSDVNFYKHPTYSRIHIPLTSKCLEVSGGTHSQACVISLIAGRKGREGAAVALTLKRGMLLHSLNV